MEFSLILDIIVLVIVLISSVVAFLRGFVREILTILGLGGAALTALTAGPMLAPGIERWLTSGMAEDSIEKMWGFIPYDIAASVFAYAGLFVITLVVLSLISHWIAKSVHAIGLGPIDRSLGVVFGIIRGIILIGLLYMPFHILMDDKDKQDWFGSSHSYSYVEATSEFMMVLMPESIQSDNDDSSENDDIDPLGDLTGENEEESSQDIGTDEDAAEEIKNEDSDTTGYDDIQRQAIDALIKNQDKIKNILNNSKTPNGGNE